MNKRLMVLCGIPGSGKSTWAKEYKKNQARQGYHIEVVSRDEIRFSLLNEEDEYFSKETQVFDTFVNTINQLLTNDYTDIVVADATHISKGSRRKLLKMLKLSNVIVEAVIFHTPTSECVKRNEKRTGRAKVSTSTIFDMDNHFYPPSLNEGFNIVAPAEMFLLRNEGNEEIYL